MGIGQVLTMPLFFASNAIYPLDIMPAWLRAICYGKVVMSALSKVEMSAFP
jgi:ABC-type multidrug transport system permease subunit